MVPEPVPKAEPDEESDQAPEPASDTEGSDFTDEDSGVAEPDDEQPEQDLAEIPDDGADIPEPDAVEESEPEPDEEVADPFDGEDDVEVDLADTQVGTEASGDDSDAPFDGEETAKSSSATEGDMAAKMEEGMAALSEDGQLPEIINEGFARLAVVGLEAGEQKDSLETEFSEVFESFRLGYFGSEAMEEYVLTGPEEEVDPLWAFTVSLALCSAVTVYMRPDGDEIVASAKDSLARFSGGVPGV